MRNGRRAACAAIGEGTYTNLLVRFLVRDEPAQADLAEQVLDEGAFIPLTVLLETAWVLRSNYGLSQGEVAAALDVILSLPAIAIPEPDLVRWATRRSADGAQIADMIHIVASRHQDAFVTFDRGVAPAAGPNCPISIETLTA